MRGQAVLGQYTSPDVARGRPGGSISGPLAVVDIGSSSSRMIVVGAGLQQHLEILADARVPLRLVREVDAGGRLGDSAVAGVVTALRGFLAVSRNAGAEALVAVATAAVRESANRDDFMRQVADASGVELEVLDGDREARYAFAGAVHGLPVESGFVVDIGCGSVEVCHFGHRRALRQWTLPLGALRLSDRFLRSDPPTPGEVERLRAFVVASLRGAGVPALGPGEQLVGTGGTLRNLAKLDRAHRTYPILRLHGYRLDAEAIDLAASRLGARPLAHRQQLCGLSHARADSIVGGALCAQALLSAMSADEVQVAGSGLREGIALERLGLEMRSAIGLRNASVAALAGRFATWDRTRARLRWAIAAALLDGLAAKTDGVLQEVLDQASVLVDIGRSVDFYSRWKHAADIVANSDLYGFDHRRLVLLSALLEKAGEDRITLPGYRAVLSRPDRAALERLAVILAVADELGRRLSASVRVRVQSWRNVVTLLITEDIGQLEEETHRRFERCFGKRLRVEFAAG